MSTQTPPLPPEWNEALHNMLAELAVAQGQLQACEEIIRRVRVKVLDLDAEKRIGPGMSQELLDVLGPKQKRPPFPLLGADLCRLDPSADGRAVLVTCDLDGRFLGNATYLVEAVRLWLKHQEEEKPGG